MFGQIKLDTPTGQSKQVNNVPVYSLVLQCMAVCMSIIFTQIVIRLMTPPQQVNGLLLRNTSYAVDYSTP